MVNHWFSQLYFNLYQLYVFSAFQIHIYVYCVWFGSAQFAIWSEYLVLVDWPLWMNDSKCNALNWFPLNSKNSFKITWIEYKTIQSIIWVRPSNRKHMAESNNLLFYCCCCCCSFDLNFYVTNSTGECTRYRWIRMLLHRTLDWIEISRHQQTRYVQCQQRLK